MTHHKLLLAEARSVIDFAISRGDFTDGKSFVPIWNTMWSGCSLITDFTWFPCIWLLLYVTVWRVVYSCRFLLRVYWDVYFVSIDDEYMFAFLLDFATVFCWHIFICLYCCSLQTHHVASTLKLFPRRFNVQSTRCVCRVVCFLSWGTSVFCLQMLLFVVTLSIAGNCIAF